MLRCDWHTHTHKSNLISRDSTNFESDLIDRALQIGLNGIGITDHANLSAHVKCLNHLKKLKEDAEKDNNEELIKKLDDFTLGLGSEIYLVDRHIIDKARQTNESTKFYHLILLAKNYNGYRALAELSSNSWDNNFYLRGYERVPTYKDYFDYFIKEHKGDLICSSACIGSEFAKLVIDFNNNPSQQTFDAVKDFVAWMKDLFGEDYYIELQPSYNEEQISYNKTAFDFALAFNVKVIITTDAHYLNKEASGIHSIFLRSQNADREVEQFYASTYLMDNKELREYFSYFNDEQFNYCLENSIELSQKIESFDLAQNLEVPKTQLKLTNNVPNILALQDLRDYPYIQNYINSTYEIDKILVEQINLGLQEKNIKCDEIVLKRLNVEMEALWIISEKLGQRMASYYLLAKELVDLIWKVSLVGVSRGSAGAFYISYVIGVVAINPLETAFNLPYWRHIDKNKVEMADIDIDSQAGERANILELLKEKYGANRVLNIGTFKTEGGSSAIQTMCRGMGIPPEESSYLSSLVVEDMSISKAYDNYDKDKKCKNLIDALLKYEGLLENVLAIEGLCCGRGIHASGVYILNEDYWNRVAMMKAPKGQKITQYDMADSDLQGCLKMDMLTISSLDRIRQAMNLMLDDKIIEWKGSLRETYNYYLAPDKINLQDKGYYKLLSSGEVIDAFQYSSPQGVVALNKIKPDNFQEVMDGNALMRLSCEGEQPIDKYVKHKADINIWYESMKETGLTEDEMSTLKRILGASYGVNATQEMSMILAMDSKIANFTLTQANKLRKAIAKAKAKYMIAEVHKLFIENGIKAGNREEFLNYVWDTNIVPQLG